MWLKRSLVEKSMCFVENAMRFVELEFCKTLQNYFKRN